MSLNGGAAAVFSSNIKIQPLASYVLEVMVKTEGLHLDRAFLSLTFLDARDVPLETISPRRLSMIQVGRGCGSVRSARNPPKHKSRSSA